jgi:hypothetical protein
MVETTWRDFYRAAVLELDRSLLKIRLKAAEDAIKARTSDARASREERGKWLTPSLRCADYRKWIGSLVLSGIESARESN